ncbi:hypothetical protein BA953_19055 [Vibrio coralliilyticus]|uniref:hypothetical protein n=1 Tax=Vibrio coralliilyticus TaxID=190893 RepID=UPI00081097A8|nr:hypothetical protein [Vibrio coralliilyticus]ANW26267.1 hypothetical protein BA953_19055 [Vibrio coralliilyticus]
MKLMHQLGLCLLVSAQAVAAPSDKLIEQYNQAAQGDEDKVESVYEQLQGQIDKQGGDALTLVYLGSTQTLMGRDAFLPWNKMKYVEQGLGTIAKGLDMLSDDTTPVPLQEIRQGLPESLLARAVAAATYTSLPDMFNHFDRGYELYSSLLSEQAFTSQSFDAIAWVYIYAIQAAIRAEDSLQAQKWAQEMSTINAQHPMTLQAIAMANNA